LADVEIDENISAEDVKLTTVLEARMTKPNEVISKMKIKIGKIIQFDGANIRYIDYEDDYSMTFEAKGIFKFH
jgi:hypothetical protein